MIAGFMAHPSTKTMNITKQSLEQIECGNGGFVREILTVYRIVKEWTEPQKKGRAIMLLIKPTG
ncbi:hypothetical protein [Synechococcus sp. MIT S1220]|uniref:hypothetical protein n=1 Tax=Synechococcus sp. MIT S1220 TaxID=3082549 RepID=UPI0039B0A45F